MNNKSRSLIAATILCSCFCLASCGDVDTNAKQAINSKSTAKNTIQVEAQSAVEQSAVNGIDVPIEFVLLDLEGNSVNAEDFRGQWLLLNYWATWCAPCRDEIPELVKFQAENDNVQILGIAYEDADVEKLKNFAKDFNVNYPLLRIDVYNPPEFAEEGGLGLPTTIVYNPEGFRHKKHMGPIDAAGLLKMIQ